MTTELEWERAKRRGAAFRAELMQEPWMLPAQAAAQRLNVSRQALDQKRARGELLGLRWASRAYRYPEWQFAPGIPEGGIGQLLRALKDEDPWTILWFFMTPDGSLGGATPRDRLLEGDLNGVLKAARGFAET